MLIDKVKAGWTVLQAGQMVLFPARWKNKQVKANMVVAFLSALVVTVKVFTGYDLHLDQETLVAIGSGLFALVNWLLTVATTDKIGITGAPASAVARPAGFEPASTAEASGQAEGLPPIGNQPTINPQTDVQSWGG